MANHRCEAMSCTAIDASGLPQEDIIKLGQTTQEFDVGLINAGPYMRPVNILASLGAGADSNPYGYFAFDRAFIDAEVIPREAVVAEREELKLRPPFTLKLKPRVDAGIHNQQLHEVSFQIR